MVVKSATKKKLMDMLVPEEFAHKLADDRKWDDVKILTAQEIAQFCETDSDTAARIHGIISGAASPSRDSTSDNSATTSVRLRRGTRRRRTAKTVQELEAYTPEMKDAGILKSTMINWLKIQFSNQSRLLLMLLESNSPSKQSMT